MISRNRLRGLAAFGAVTILVGISAASAQMAPLAPPAQALTPSIPAESSEPTAGPDYKAGADDLLSITVLEAPELNRSARVTAAGEISIPLLGVFRVAGLATRDIEVLLQDRLRKTYMRDPHVSVQVTEMQSHTISVVGSVNKPGTFQIRGPRRLLEVISLAQGVASDAGDKIIVMRATATATPAAKSGQPENATAEASSQSVSPSVVEVSAKRLMQDKNPEDNLLIYPGDVVKVTSAGVIYIVGEVKTPGAFPMNEHDKLTVLRALSLGQGLTPTAAGKDARIIRTLDTGAHQELPINLSELLKGKIPDVTLQARDIVFVPNSTAKSVAQGTLAAILKVIVVRPY